MNFTTTKHMEPSKPFISEKDITLAQVLLQALKETNTLILDLANLQDNSSENYAEDIVDASRRAEILVNSLDYIAKN